MRGKRRQGKSMSLVDANNEGWVRMDKPAVFLTALGCYGDSTLDFVDALLWAYRIVEQQEVFTFDNQLLKHIRQTAEFR